MCFIIRNMLKSKYKCIRNTGLKLMKLILRIKFGKEATNEIIK